MSDPSDRTFTGDFKQFFLRGLVVLLPTVLTLWLVVQAYSFIDKSVAEPINRGVRVGLSNAARFWEPLRGKFDPNVERNPDWSAALEKNATWRASLVEGGPAAPQEMVALRAQLRKRNINSWWAERWYMDLIGLVVAVIAVYIAGRLLGGFFGRRIYRKLEYLITQLPFFKQVYPYVKQVVDFVFSDEQQLKFNRVVAIEYPRKGIWSVGFMTGGPLRSIHDRAGDSATVFVPSSPTPFTGYTITVPVQDLIELPITVDEAIRFAVSGGVLVPPHQQIGDGNGPMKPSTVEVPSGLIPIPEPDAGPGPTGGRGQEKRAS